MNTNGTVTAQRDQFTFCSRLMQDLAFVDAQIEIENLGHSAVLTVKFGADLIFCTLSLPGVEITQVRG